MRFYKGTCTTMELDSSFVKTFSQDLQNCRDLFAALGDQVRQQILLALTHSTVPGMRVGEITAKTKLSRPAVSHHIRILKNAGIIAVSYTHLDVFLRIIFRLLFRQQTLFHQLLHHRMITGNLFANLLVDDVRPAVSYIQHHSIVVIQIAVSYTHL